MLQIRETFVNETKGRQFGDSGWYEPFTDDRGQLFKSLQREYGRCVSSVYIDRSNKPPLRVGWVFSKRMEYDDARDSWSKDKRFYIREVWVSTREIEDANAEAED